LEALLTVARFSNLPLVGGCRVDGGSDLDGISENVEQVEQDCSFQGIGFHVRAAASVFAQLLMAIEAIAVVALAGQSKPAMRAKDGVTQQVAVP
jgi:hypothetical protein